MCLNRSHALVNALKEYMECKGFDVHSPHSDRVIRDICIEIDEEVERYTILQKVGKLRDY